MADMSGCAVPATKARTGNGRRFAPVFIAAKKCCGIGQHLSRILDAAFLQIAPDPMHDLRCNGRTLHQIGVRCVVTGYANERRTFSPRRLLDLFQPVGPISGTADQAHDDQLGVFDHPFDHKIHRQVMLEAHDVREAQTWCVFGPCRLCRLGGRSVSPPSEQRYPPASDRGRPLRNRLQ